MRFVRIIWPVAIIGIAGGCIAKPQHPSATQPATAVNLATTQPSYWLDQPAVAMAVSNDFETLWSACEQVARGYFFRLDRTDYRTGLLTTYPMTSAQWFEFWRHDTPTSYDRTESSLASIRRTVRFEFSRDAEGVYSVVPKVLIERMTLAEQRITSVVLYRSAFVRPGDVRLRQFGTRESDVGTLLPTRYWYPIRRDEQLEENIAQAVQKRVDKALAAQKSPDDRGS